MRPNLAGRPVPIRILGPRKQRTRQHVIADLSVHHLEGFILEAGHTAQRIGSDYGYDLVMTTFDEEGYIEPGWVYFQVKAMETLDASGADFVYDLDIRDYNLWIKEKMPVVLVLFDATRRHTTGWPSNSISARTILANPRGTREASESVSQSVRP